MNIKDFKVGQTVFVELTGNACRRKKQEECIEEWEITSVGRKYIKAGRKSERWGIINETTFEWRNSYNRFVNKSDYCIDYILYEKRQEIEDKNERQQLFDEISKVFKGYVVKKLTLEQLRKIKMILDVE